MSTNFRYDSYGNSIDGTDYCSGVETFAQNLIEDNANDAAIIFPSANSWATPRTQEYKLSDSNAEIILPQKIYKLISAVINLDNIDFTVTVMVNKGDGGTTAVQKRLREFQNEKGEHLSAINLRNYIVDENTWNALPSGVALSNEILHKENCLYYSDNIIHLAMSKKYWFGGSTTWVQAVISAAKYNPIEGNYFIVHNNGKYYLKDSETKKSADTNEVTSLKFRVSYIPMSSDIKLRARKSVKQNEEYIQILNQRAEINSASALGKFMYNTAQKMGTEQITLVKFYTKIGDIPPLGCRVKHNGQHYILTANSIEMTNCVQVKVTHTLSKNWSNKSQYVSVDQKYRNYKIPADILWRNMLWEDHVVVSKQRYETEIENKGSLLAGKWLPHLYCNRNGDVTVTSLFLTRKDPVTQRNIGAVVPCTTLGPAKSIVFAGSMKDQLSAGLRINPSQPDYCEEVFYCDDNGKLKEGTITLADNIEHFDAAQYPYTEWSVQDGQEYYLNSPGYDVFRATFSIDKDPGEALKFIYQCHFVEDDPDILIGDKLTETHHLIKKWPTDRKFRFWRLNRFLRQGVDKVYSQDGEYRQIDADTDREKYWTISIDQTDRSGTLTLQSNANNYLGAGNVGWAITDENNNLYIGCNDVSTRKLIFNFMHEWK